MKILSQQDADLARRHENEIYMQNYANELALETEQKITQKITIQ